MSKLNLFGKADRKAAAPASEGEPEETAKAEKDADPEAKGEEGDNEEDNLAALTSSDAKAAKVSALARVAERGRIQKILGSKAAQTRPQAAQLLAFDTDKSPQAAEARLLSLPEEQVHRGSRLDAVMSAKGNPTVTPDQGIHKGAATDGLMSAVEQRAQQLKK